MPSSYRIDRVSDEIRRRLTQLIQTEMKDPRLSFMSSITRVELSPDLHYAKVHVSVMGTPEEQKESITALKSGAGFLRRELGVDFNLRHIPALQFVLDHSIEEGDRILQVIQSVSERPLSEAGDGQL